ncbi:MAG: amidohydrolase family protein, partial [Firmicutes bacterium]|nr:amidohydrolase family protein [Bacillota bacterium]
EFVWKTSTVPARMLGLETKGHFTPGADADITVIDLTREEPILTIVSGEIVMQNGIVFGRGGTILTTEMGARRLKQDGVPHRVVQLASAEMYRR